MKRIILVSAIALLAACGSSSNGVSVGSETDQTSVTTDSVAAADAADTTVDSSSGDDTTITSIEGSDDTITVEDFGDMPPKCIELLSTFLKKIEPTVSKIDWETATVAEFETFGEQFQAESEAFDAETEASGCNKYNLSGSDDKQFQQMAELAAAEAPGTLGFIQFLAKLTGGASAGAGSIPSDCAGTIAAIEPYLANGTMGDLTVAEITTLGQLMSAVQTNCSPEESTAFFAREDVTAFIGG